MGYKLSSSGMNSVLSELSREYRIFAPKSFEGMGHFSDTDLIRYGEIKSIDEIVLDKKSQFSFKEIVFPVSETLFYFTENQVKSAEEEQKKTIVFLRSCDLHSLRRLDDTYLSNGPEDFYYKRLRDKVKFALIGCRESFENCFCVDMETSKSENYSFSLDMRDGDYHVDCRESEWAEIFKVCSSEEIEVIPDYVTENKVRVSIPENLGIEVSKSSMWDEYDSRCIDCGRCNFVCPTCTCFTMQDIFYTDNGKVGERRRVWASCMVDGFTDVAGGGSYRQKNGQRMRFKVLHKVLDYKQRNGYHMCTGCGRCDDVCPEYISFSNTINKLEAAMKEVTGDGK